MEKLYRQLPWLDMGQALDYLQRLTNTPITEQGLLQLGRSRRIDVYVEIDPRGLTGTASDTKEELTLVGMQQVLNPDMAFERGWEQTCAVFKHGDAHWIGLLPSWSQKALFKSADIEALAVRMNGKAELSNASELEILCQQLDAGDDRAKVTGPESIDRGESLIMSRVESVGLMAVTRVTGDSAPATIGGCQRDIERWCKILALLGLQVVREQGESRACASSDVSSCTALGEDEALRQGLTFPYATKELEAMCEAAEKFWASHTPDKRQPTQKEIGITIGELLRLPRQSSGDPARKAIALAAAIKPDTAPDT